jgi:hypothetical protein
VRVTRLLTAAIIPIVGARTEAQMEAQMTENLGVLAVELPPDALARLDDESRIELGLPHTFLKDEEVIGLIHGDTFSQIDAALRPAGRESLSREDAVPR